MAGTAEKLHAPSVRLREGGLRRLWQASYFHFHWFVCTNRDTLEGRQKPSGPN